MYNTCAVCAYLNPGEKIQNYHIKKKPGLVFSFEDSFRFGADPNIAVASRSRNITVVVVFLRPPWRGGGPRPKTIQSLWGKKTISPPPPEVGSLATTQWYAWGEHLSGKARQTEQATGWLVGNDSRTRYWKKG